MKIPPPHTQLQQPFPKHKLREGFPTYIWRDSSNRSLFDMGGTRRNRHKVPQGHKPGGLSRNQSKEEVSCEYVCILQREEREPRAVVWKPLGEDISDLMEQALDNPWGKGLLLCHKNAGPRIHMTTHRACLATLLLFLPRPMTSAEPEVGCVSLQLHQANRLLKPGNSHKLMYHQHMVSLPYH